MIFAQKISAYYSYTKYTSSSVEHFCNMEYSVQCMLLLQEDCPLCPWYYTYELIIEVDTYYATVQIFKLLFFLEKTSAVIFDTNHYSMEISICIYE